MRTMTSEERLRRLPLAIEPSSSFVTNASRKLINSLLCSKNGCDFCQFSVRFRDNRLTYVKAKVRNIVTLVHRLLARVISLWNPIC